MFQNGRILKKLFDKVKYWTDIAEYDLITANVMLESKRYLYVGFMCHQAIEKILKALYVKKFNTTPPYIHNLLTLAEKIDIKKLLNENQLELIDELVPLNIEARYPTYKEAVLNDLNKQNTASLLLRTKDLMEWIKNKL